MPKRDSKEIYELICGGIKQLQYDLKEQKWEDAINDLTTLTRLTIDYREALA